MIFAGAWKHAKLSVRVVSLSGVAVLLLASGCSDAGEDKVHFAGTATYRGTPIAYGKIELSPTAMAETSAVAGSAIIVGGKFDTRIDGAPAPPGQYELTVYGFEAEAGEPPPLEYRVPLFPQYSSQIEIGADSLNLTINVPSRTR